MKNTIKITILASTLVAFMFVNTQKVAASGAYGSGIVVDTPEVHTTVDAGLADMLPQLSTLGLAFSGLITTSLLIKKTK